MDFASLPADALHRYLIAWDVVPAGMMSGSVGDGVMADVHDQMARTAERHFVEKTSVNELDVPHQFPFGREQAKVPRVRNQDQDHDQRRLMAVAV